MKKIITICIIAFLAGTAHVAAAQEGGYVAPPVSISKEKTRNEAGELCYSHVVLERQTLFSISKAYGVSLQDIYDANKSLNLETEGLKKNQIILIPVEATKAEEQAAEEEKPEESASEAASQQTQAFAKKVSKLSSEQDYFIHKVKWYEDLDAIAASYGIPKSVIMAFNGMDSDKVKKKQQLKIPVSPENVELPQEETVDTEAEAIASEQSERESGDVIDAIEDKLDEWAEDSFIFGRQRELTANLILPFDASGAKSESSFDFYCGVLLALKDLENEGLHVNLNVFDSAHNAMPASGSDFERADVTIGPISTTDLENALAKCPSDKFIVSPLEPKAASLAETYGNLIQAPSTSEMQCEELVDWLREDLRPSEKVILFTERGATLSANAQAIVNRLQSSGISYSTITYGILEGRNITTQLQNACSMEHTNRVVVASESEAFVNDVIRNVNLMIFREYQMVLYCPSKVRSFDTIEVEHFHNAKMHVCMSYYIDYDDPRVMDFLRSYRALYNTEPGPFSFQGYDTAYQFIKAASEGGRRWPARLSVGKTYGLQSDFSLERTASGSLINTAVRRVIYDDNFNIRLVK